MKLDIILVKKPTGEHAVMIDADGRPVLDWKQAVNIAGLLLKAASEVCGQRKDFLISVSKLVSDLAKGPEANPPPS